MKLNKVGVDVVTTLPSSSLSWEFTSYRVSPIAIVAELRQTRNARNVGYVPPDRCTSMNHGALLADRQS